MINWGRFMYFPMVNTSYNPRIIQLWDIFKWYAFNTYWKRGTLSDLKSSIKAIIQREE